VNSFKKLKYLGINLTKEVTNLYNETHKLLKKEINEDLRRWKDILCSWIRRNIVKNILPYVQCNLYQNSNDVLHRNRKINLKVHMEARKTRRAKAILSQKRNADFKLTHSRGALLLKMHQRRGRSKKLIST
jgi:hypothetical protein